MTNFGRGNAPCHHVINKLTSHKTDLLPPLCFSSANGLPFGSYLHFLRYFSTHYTISGTDNRGAWPQHSLPEKGHDWHDHADDLIAFIEHRHTQPVIAMGHSLGATVSLLAAIKRPSLFKSLVLIDPASLPNRATDLIYRKLPNRSNPLVWKTRKRKYQWDSRAAFTANYRSHQTYKNFTEQAFNDYAQYGLTPIKDGKFHLSYHPAWEAHNFSKVLYIWKYLKHINIPTLFLRAEHSYLYTEHYFEKHRRTLPDNITTKQIPNVEHLAPQQNPELVSAMILDWLTTQLF